MRPDIDIKNPYLRLKRGYWEWFETLPAEVAFTGTAKACRQHGGVTEWLTPELLADNVRYVIKRLSRDVFGRSREARRQRLQYHGVVEGGQGPFDKRLHVHLAVAGVPPDWPLDRFRDALEYLWQTSPWGHQQVRSSDLLTAEDRSRWNTYLMKDFCPARPERWITNVRLD